MPAPSPSCLFFVFSAAMDSRLGQRNPLWDEMAHLRDGFPSNGDAIVERLCT